MKTPLNFTWAYIAGFEKSFLKVTPAAATIVDIPHNMVDFPFNYFDERDFDRIGTYIKVINIAEIDPAQTFILRFEGVNNSFTLYINEAQVGTYARPYMEENIDVTQYVKTGENRLVVVVSGSEAINAPPFGHTIDYFVFPGIYREVSLFVHERVALLDAKIMAFASGEIQITPHILNNDERPYTLTYEVYDDNTLITTSQTNAFVVENPKLWSINHPHIYALRIILEHDGIKTYYGFSFGFRTITFTTTGFYLNDVLTPLVGLNRHETFPYLGGAATSYLQFSDVVSLKELGVNYVRCSHYPPSRHFLDACDYLGLMVINEVPGWQHIGDEAWQNIHLQNIETMINRDYNHPSIIAWSIRINESVDHPMYKKGQALAKALDPYRPTTGTRNFAHSEPLEDIYSFNDFSHDGTTNGLLPKRKVTKTKKPYIVSENNGHMYPTKPYDSRLIRENHTKRHLKVLDAFFKDKKIVGISPWCMHDYYTHKEFGSGDKICYHGVQDIYRQPKDAAYVYSANFSSTPVLFPLFRGDKGDLPEARLYPTLVLSNAHHIKLFKGNDLIKTYYPRRDLYKHLPHPPFVIDTYISENFISPLPIKKGDRKPIQKILNYAAINNFERIPLFMKLRLFYYILKYKLNRGHLVELWSANVVGWGQKGSAYEVVSYDEHDQEIMRVPLVETTKTEYKFTLTKNELHNGETYDMTTLLIESVNPFRNTYDFSSVKISVSGPVSVIGPTTQVLHGGSLVIAFRSHQTPGSATISVSVHDTTKSFNVIVK